MLKKIDHLGIAVKNLEEAQKMYMALGIDCTGIEEVPSQKVRVAFFPVGESRVELLEPTSEDSPIAKFIEKKGTGIHHVAFKVDNVESALQQAESNGFTLIDKVPRAGAGGNMIAFLHPKTTGGTLIELCQGDH